MKYSRDCFLRIESLYGKRGFVLRFGFALLFVWLFLALGLSGFYIHHLTTPECLYANTDAEEYESVMLTTESGLVLSGWWHSPENGVVILLLGGHGSSRDTMLPIAEMLVRHGYGSLTVDYRHCVGERATLGYREVEELRSMAAFAGSQPQVEKLAVLGFSVGGVVAFRGAAEMPELEAVIAMGNYANLYDEITSEKEAPFLLRWPVQQAVVLMYALFTGANPADLSPLDALPQIAPRPVLLVQGELEVDENRGEMQRQAGGENTSLWVVPGSGHGNYFQSRPQEFEARLTAFLEDALSE